MTTTSTDADVTAAAARRLRRAGRALTDLALDGLIAPLPGPRRSDALAEAATAAPALLLALGQGVSSAALYAPHSLWAHQVADEVLGRSGDAAEGVSL